MFDKNYQYDLQNLPKENIMTGIDKKTGVILEDDFIPYIIPKVSIRSADGKSFSISEDNESFFAYSIV